MKEANRIDRGSTLVENTKYRKAQSIVKRALQCCSQDQAWRHKGPCNEQEKSAM
jgi:hypothetical protein